MEEAVLKAAANEWRKRIVLYLGEYPQSTLSDVERGLRRRLDYVPTHSTMWRHMEKLRRAGLIKTWRRRRQLRLVGNQCYRHSLSSQGEDLYRLWTGREPWSITSNS